MNKREPSLALHLYTVFETTNVVCINITFVAKYFTAELFGTTQICHKNNVS